LDTLSVLDTLDVLDRCLGYIDPDGLQDLSGSIAEKVQNPARYPKKEQLTRMKLAFRPGRDKVQLVGPVGVASSLSSSDLSVSLCSSVRFVPWFSM
jgi:hypothetical protein